MKIKNLINNVKYGEKGSGTTLDPVSGYASTVDNLSYDNIQRIVLTQRYAVVGTSQTEETMKALYSELKLAQTIAYYEDDRNPVQENYVADFVRIANLESGATVKYYANSAGTAGEIVAVAVIDLGDHSFKENVTMQTILELTATAYTVANITSVDMYVSLDYYCDNPTGETCYEITRVSGQNNIDFNSCSALYMFGFDVDADSIALQYGSHDYQNSMRSLVTRMNIINQVEDYIDDIAELVDFGGLANNVNANVTTSSTIRFLSYRSMNTVEKKTAQRIKNARVMRKMDFGKLASNRVLKIAR